MLYRSIWRRAAFRNCIPGSALRRDMRTMCIKGLRVGPYDTCIKSRRNANWINFAGCAHERSRVECCFFIKELRLIWSGIEKSKWAHRSLPFPVLRKVNLIWALLLSQLHTSLMREKEHMQKFAFRIHTYPLRCWRKLCALDKRQNTLSQEHIKLSQFRCERLK